MKRNYQKELDKILEGISGEGRTPSLLLHSCCAPCSSYVLEYLSRYFRITVFYYNPNIYPEEEYRHRVEEQKRLIGRMPLDHPVDFAEGPFNCGRFYEKVRGTEDIPEGGERCFRCYELRLREAGKKAAELHCDYFTTTLSISPLKNAEKLNEIGIRLGEEFQVPYLVSDFKKRDGYKRSIELSAEYGLYRQDYCGCVFSRKEAQERKQRASAREA
ncbi:MAG TPA: epoxyqueuosine reductase QueH [Candidatus Scatomonas pullistercoris]|uniref:Epoxyqueuosine reductase QueH n=1 Tax=Candidatus Scatomonas pullistercoris TaxID=2840920 RepID=A0A9D1P3U9_9FIRM|nr:epoxyqueuosine reductase QueH [Candidatus Scatomonas pullistercoris]